MKTIENSNVEDEPGRRGMSVKVQCKPGWETSDGKTSYMLHCGAKTGQWEGDARPCSQLVSCGDIPLVEGALHNGRHSRPGSRIEYTCFGGRTLLGNSTILCGDDGQWTPHSLPRCIY